MPDGGPRLQPAPTMLDTYDAALPDHANLVPVAGHGLCRPIKVLPTCSASHAQFDRCRRTEPCAGDGEGGGGDGRGKGGGVDGGGEDGVGEGPSACTEHNISANRSCFIVNCDLSEVIMFRDSHGDLRADDIACRCVISGAIIESTRNCTARRRNARSCSTKLLRTAGTNYGCVRREYSSSSPKRGTRSPTSFGSKATHTSTIQNA